MCEPTTILMVTSAISAAGVIGSHVVQTRNANEARSHAQIEADLQQNDISRQQDQQRMADAARMNDAARAAQADLATFDVIAGEYGGGASVARGRSTASIGQQENFATLAQNARTAQQEGSFTSLAAKTAASSRLASIKKPSFIETGLKLAGVAGDHYTKTLPKPGK